MRVEKLFIEGESLSDTASPILNLDTRWWRVVNFTSQPPYPRDWTLVTID